MPNPIECKECTLPVLPYKGDVLQVDPHLCEACMLTIGVPDDFTPNEDLEDEVSKADTLERQLDDDLDTKV